MLRYLLIGLLFQGLPIMVSGQMGLSLGGSLTSQTGEGGVEGRLATLQAGLLFRFPKDRLIQPLLELNYEGRGYKKNVFSHGAGFVHQDKNRLHYLVLNPMVEFVPEKEKGLIAGGGMSIGYLLFAQQIHGRDDKDSVTEDYDHEFALKARIGYAFKMGDSGSLRVLFSAFRGLTDVQTDGSISHNYGQSLLLQRQF